MIESVQPRAASAPQAADSAGTRRRLPKWFKSEGALLAALLALSVLTWLPRFEGPIDLRWDGGVYYILGTALAEGEGYKLLSEPGEIAAVQYPPLLPALVAAHQLVLGTNDPTTVGRRLRVSAFVLFVVYIYVVFRFLKNYLSPPRAFLATILCLFSLHVYFLSDLLFPEILFSLVTLLFILCGRREASRLHPVSAYLFAVASYALRTVGMAAFAAWVLESLVRRRFKQAVLRAALVAVPVLCWQFYIASVESSYEYNHPAYAYQRAPYMFYNVSYARNVSLRDPFAPEKGGTSPVKIVRRFVRNAFFITASLGEALTTTRGYWETGLALLFGDGAGARRLISWGVLVPLYIIGLFVLCGLVRQLLRRQWLVPLYAFVYFAAICLTPFPEQYPRYLMPVTPLLALSLMVFLSDAREASRRRLPAQWAKLGSYLAVATLSVALLTEAICFVFIYTLQHQRIAYRDRHGRSVEYRQFYYNESYQGFDQSVDYVRQKARPDDVIAAGTPHWIYLLTGLKAVMPPFEQDASEAQQLLDSVPVSYLIVGQDVVGAERYTLPVVRQFPERWKQVYSAPEGGWAVYQREAR